MHPAAAAAQATATGSRRLRTHLAAAGARQPAAAAGAQLPQQRAARVDHNKGATPQICLPEGRPSRNQRVARGAHSCRVGPAGGQLVQQLLPGCRRRAAAAIAAAAAKQPAQQALLRGSRRAAAAAAEHPTKQALLLRCGWLGAAGTASTRHGNL